MAVDEGPHLRITVLQSNLGNSWIGLHVNPAGALELRSVDDVSASDVDDGRCLFVEILEPLRGETAKRRTGAQLIGSTDPTRAEAMGAHQLCDGQARLTSCLCSIRRICYPVAMPLHVERIESE